ncbi:MAG: hypothetical protein JXB36_01805 [Gammaproteobacteria bacterium]|nr:hypothetical protein [Gammaproteobacteria bacterium]
MGERLSRRSAGVCGRCPAARRSAGFSPATAEARPRRRRRFPRLRGSTAFPALSGIDIKCRIRYGAYLTDKNTTICIDRRFCGPQTSANGGYICGLVAKFAQRPVTVRLLAPPPLDAPLDLVQVDEGPIEVRHDGQVVAQARPGHVGDLEPPPAPTHEAALEAAQHFAGFRQHPAPTCFVCGPHRPRDDGLRIFPGRISDPGAGDVVAAPWMPDSSLDPGDGIVAPEFIWAALDCPGYVAVAPDMRAMLLGELTASVERPVRIGDACVVVGWGLGSSGRKHVAGTALYDSQGRLCGRARATWIEPRAQAERA